MNNTDLKHIGGQELTKQLILIVDDNTDNIKVTANYLKQSDVDIVIATNGSQALSIAESKRPDVVILDIMMPGMDGYEVCRKLKENPVTREIPVVFITGKIDRDEITKAYEVGASDLLLKPVVRTELMARINNFKLSNFYKAEFTYLKNNISRLERELNEFLGIAAHDLKNPIYSISMLAKVIRDEKDLGREDIDEFSQDIVTISERMLSLIKNILDLNAIEQGKMKILLEDFAVSELVIATVDNYRERAKAKGITIIGTIDNKGLRVNADRTGVLQTLDNLVSNAVKYSPHGKKIWVNTTTRDGVVRIEVRDEGPGLTDEDKAKLFGKFARLSAQPTGDEQSSGLGLSIVKKYVEAMNGRVWCESTPGKGASFLVELVSAKSQQ